MQPITESSNILSKDIDVAIPLDIVNTLYKCDQEIFDGFEDFKSLFHADILETIGDVAKQVTDILQTGDGTIVLSGCGTSGRLGSLAARAFNERLQDKGHQHLYQYIIAGGDKALFTSQEAPEDDPVIGVRMLKEATAGKSKVVFIGITCGLSAPFVAGQLEYCMDHPDVYIPVLLGFNPVHLARNIQIEKWDKTFLQVAQRLEGLTKDKRGFLLNPVVGPEPITGSSRMKSGTATKMLVDAIFVAAHIAVFKPNLNWSVSDHLKCYTIISETVNKQQDPLSEVLHTAGQSLLSGGHVYYLGNDSQSLFGMIDASECPPTFGSTLDDIRGFVGSGYAMLRNIEGDLSHLGQHFRISIDDFVSDVVPTLSEKDTIIFLNTERTFTCPHYLTDTQCQKVLLTYEQVSTDGFNLEIYIEYPTLELSKLIGSYESRDLRPLFCEMATKWCLNTISTGAHILKGKVYQNIMIDVKASNNKLFHRAIRIIETLGKVSQTEARRCLLKSIYGTEQLTAQQEEAAVADHILEATQKDKVVPVALIAAVARVPVKTAAELLTTKSVVQKVIADILKAVHS